MSNEPTIDGNNPASVLAGVVNRCQATVSKVAATKRRVQELGGCTDPAVKAAEIDSLSLGMMVGILDNQALIFAALVHLLKESAERHAARVQLVRPGMHGISGGRIG